MPRDPKKEEFLREIEGKAIPKSLLCWQSFTLNLLDFYYNFGEQKINL